MWPTHLLVAAAFGTAAISFAHPSATRQYTWAWVALLALLWLAPLLAIVGRLSFQTQWNWPPALLCLALGLLSGITGLSAALSPFTTQSILRIWPTLGGAALFFWLHDWLAESGIRDQTRNRLLARGLAGFGAILGVISVLGWAWNIGAKAWSTRNDFPFGHSIYTAGAMVLIFPWLVFASLTAKGFPRVFWMAAAAINLLGLVATSSRSGVLAVAAVCIASAILLAIRAPWSRETKAGVVVLALGILALAVYSNPRLRELAHGGGWSDIARESNVQRNAMLEAGLRLGAMRPWIGWGPGTVPLAYPQVRHLLSGGVDNVLELHNTPIQLWATLGTGGIVSLVFILVAFGRRLWQVARCTAFPSASFPAGGSLVGYGLFALTDHQLDLPAMNFLIAVNLALFFSAQQETRPRDVSRSTKWLLGSTLLVFLSLPLFFTGRDLLARLAYDQSLVLFEDGRPDEAMEYLETAALRAPYDPYYRHQLAGRLLKQREKETDLTKIGALTARATHQLELSLASDCFQEFAHFNLGWLALETTDPAQAIPHFFATVREAPHRGGAYFGLGLALRATGNESAAVRAFALEWINDPISFTAPLWEWPDFAPLRPAVLRESNSLLTELAPTESKAVYVRDMWSWWEGGTILPANGFNQESDAFARLLASLTRNQPIAATAAKYRWGLLFEAWKHQPNRAAFAALVNDDEAFVGSLSNRAARHSTPDWHAFLASGLENESNLLVSTRFSRSGYGVLALHPDGPVLTNLYVMQQNRLVATFASGLFPPKGWLPARELLTRLPVLPAAR